jgi:hypothetical protein
LDAFRPPLSPIARTFILLTLISRFPLSHKHNQVLPPVKNANGKRVKLASCRCPVGSDVDGFPIPAGAPFMHEAGIRSLSIRLTHSYVTPTHLSSDVVPVSIQQVNATPTTAHCCPSGSLTRVAAPRASAWAFQQRYRRLRVSRERCGGGRCCKYILLNVRTRSISLFKMKRKQGKKIIILPIRV